MDDQTEATKMCVTGKAFISTVHSVLDLQPAVSTLGHTGGALILIESTNRIVRRDIL